MQEGKTGNALKESDHRWTRIEPILPSAPRLQRGPGDIKLLSSLPLRQSLDLQAAILLKEFGASEASPASVTINLAPLFAIDDSTHSYLLPKPPSCANLDKIPGVTVSFGEPGRSRGIVRYHKGLCPLHSKH
jgi:hypothetical protein